jgi:hypothetical protein
MASAKLRSTTASKILILDASNRIEASMNFQMTFVMDYLVNGMETVKADFVLKIKISLAKINLKI